MKFSRPTMLIFHIKRYMTGYYFFHSKYLFLEREEALFRGVLFHLFADAVLASTHL